MRMSWVGSPVVGSCDQSTTTAGPVRAIASLSAAGPGWPMDLPAGVARLTTLPEAVGVITSAVSAGHGPENKKGIPI